MLARAFLLCVVMGLAAAFTPTTDPNMNGEKYLLQATPHGQGALANWSTEFRDYPGVSGIARQLCRLRLLL